MNQIVGQNEFYNTSYAIAQEKDRFILIGGKQTVHHHRAISETFLNIRKCSIEVIINNGNTRPTPLQDA